MLHCLDKESADVQRLPGDPECAGLLLDKPIITPLPIKYNHK